MHLLAKFAGINIVAELKGPIRNPEPVENNSAVWGKIGFNWKNWFNHLDDAESVPIAMPVMHQMITFHSPSASIFPVSSPPCLLLSSQQPLSSSPQSL